MEEVISRFLAYLLQEKAAAINTLDAYRTDLRQFAQFRQNYPQKISLKAIIRGYLSSLREKGYSQASCVRKFAALRSFFDWLKTEGILEINPTEGIGYPPRKPPMKPEILPSNEIMALWKILFQSQTKEAIRDLAIAKLFLATGIKSAKLVSLDIDKVYLTSSNPYIKVELNKKIRVILIPLETAEVLKRYIHEVRGGWLRGRKERALFLNQRGRRLTRQGVWFILRKHARKAGIKGNITPSRMRHSFAIQQLSSGISRNELQKRLGYASVSGTAQYIKS